MKRLCSTIVTVLALGACTATPQPTPSPSSSKPPSATIDARGLPLFAGADRAVRIGFGSAEGAAQVLVSVYAPADRTKPAYERARPSGLRLNICPLKDFDAAVTVDGRCARDIGNGVRESVARPGMAGIAIVALTATEDVLADVAIEFVEKDRAVSLVMPLLRAPAGGANCSDNGCNPFFEVRPERKGAFTATARWTGPAARFVLLQGRVIGRSQTATGIPYRNAALDEGRSPASLQATLGAPAEYALAFGYAVPEPGQASIRDVRIDARWP